MYSKQEIIDKLKIGELNFFEMVENTENELFEDFQVARAIVGAFGAMGIGFLEHSTSFPTKPRQWRKLNSMLLEKEVEQNPFDDLGVNEPQEPEEKMADLVFDESQESEEKRTDLTDAWEARVEEVETQIEKTKTELARLNDRLDELKLQKVSWVELFKVELEIQNSQQTLEYFESVKLGLIHNQSYEKENELENIRERNERLEQVKEQVADFDKSHGMDDRSPFIG